MNNSTKCGIFIQWNIIQSTENYEALLEEIVKDTMKWEDTTSSQTGKINIVKMAMLSKQYAYLMQFHQNPNVIF